MIYRILILCLVLILPTSLLAQEEYAENTSQKREIKKEDKERLLKLLPCSNKLELISQGESSFYGENLYEYINGAAPAYHDYDFELLLVQPYKKGEIEITVEIYDMGNRLNAFGIYSVERSPDNDYLEIGAEGYGDSMSLNFLQDRYYIKLQAYGENEEETEKALQLVSKCVSKKIKKGKKLPKFLKRIPGEQQINHSQQYLNKSPLGHEVLAPAFKADYQWNNEHSGSLLVSLAKNRKEAIGRIEKLASHFEKAGKLKPLSDFGEHVFGGESEFEGKFIFFPYLRFAIVIVNPPQHPKGFIEMVKKHMGDKKKKLKTEK